MTIAVAATFLLNDRSAFLLVADARASFDGDHSDTAIKTYTLDTEVGAVGSGDAMSCATAIEMTRGLIADHNSLDPAAPFNFYSTVRVFSYFLDKIDRARPWSNSCEVVLAGFLENGRPALAKVISRRGERTEVHLYTHGQPGPLIMLTGRPEGKRQVVLSLKRAFAEDQDQWPARVASSIWYLGQHQGVPSIGGGVALARCVHGGPMVWPRVEVGGRIYLRGLDVTDCLPAGIPPGTVRLHYDESWHALTDQMEQMPETSQDESFAAMPKYVDEWVPDSEAFNLQHDSPQLGVVDSGAPTATIVLLRPKELPPE
jgi:hypothetical protein